MPRQQHLPDYENDQAEELIRQHIHNRIDRRMLFLRLVEGCTFREITDMILAEEGIQFEEKTVRIRVHKGETIIFKHIPS